jgi:hypothetical protein
MCSSRDPEMTEPSPLWLWLRTIIGELSIWHSRDAGGARWDLCDFVMTSGKFDMRGLISFGNPFIVKVVVASMIMCRFFVYV